MTPFNPFSALGAKLAMLMSAMLLTVLLISTYNHKRDIKLLEADKQRLITRVATAERNLGTCQANSRSLRAAIDRQNASVAAMGQATAEAAQRGQKALDDARKGNAAVLDKVAELGKRPPLPAGADQCKAADALIKETVK
jgi:multidrug resistance efflux pump